MSEIVIDIFIVLLKLLGAYLLYQRLIRMCYLRWLYGQRGVSFMSTIPIPLVGDIYELVKRIK